MQCTASALAFTPVNQQHHHLTPAEVHQCINVVCALATDVSDEVHYALGVCFVGVIARELETLMHSMLYASASE